MEELLIELEENNIHLSLDGENLRLKFSQEELPPELIAKLRSRKGEIVEYLRASGGAPSGSGIRRIEGSNQGYPLSSSQKRLWILDQYEGGLAAYNISQQLELNGDYDLVTFQKAVHLVIDRHEILRTVFRKNNTGEIRQWVIPTAEFDFQIQTENFSLEPDPEERAAQFIKQDVSRSFDLEKGPLISAFFLQIGQERFIFYYNIHHIIGDGWSLGVLARDVITYYRALESGVIPDRPPLNIQYKDYASWQISKFDTPDYQQQRSFWLDRLSGDLPVLSLPADKSRPPVKTQSGSALEMYLNRELTARIKSLAQQQGGSLFMMVLAISKVLLYKYSGQKEILIGSPVSGRNHADLEDQIGFYVNTVVLKSKIDPAASFLRFFQQLKADTLAAFSHQDYPFDHLLDDLNLQRDVSRSPIFDAMIALQNTSRNMDEIPAGVIDDQVYDKGVHLSKFDLEINFAEVADRLLFHLNFNHDVYSKALFSGFMRHFVVLAEYILDHPQLAIRDLRCISMPEEQQQLAVHNNTACTFPRHSNIIDLFTEQVKKRPDKTALTDGSTTYTYAQLDQLSNQLAHFLNNNYELRKEELIGILLEPDAWVVIAILGILKTGSAYVPMGIDHPEERLNYIRQDTDLKICIDRTFIQQFQRQQANLPTEPIRQLITPDHLAYVIYTSGTTGVPKGVLIEHKNVVRLFFTDQPMFDFNASDVWCLFHSYYFDFSVWEIFGALLFGGKLVVIPKTETKDLTAFARRLETEKITVLNQTPTVFEQLQKIILSAQHTSLAVRYLIFGGEALVPSTLRTWKTTFPGCTIVNMYGITETTVHVTYKEITAREMALPASNIGRPIPTLGCIVLDEYQNIVPTNVVGELYVFGDGLARAYLNKASLTAARFQTLSFQSIGDIRVYRTGDLVKTNEAGEMIYCGRIDNQVKIRGHRIELGEIEHYLLAKPDIEEVLVVSIENDQRQNELVAYVVASQAQNAIDLRHHLGTKVPDYAIPAYFVQLDELPLTANGKIDKKNLPLPENNLVNTGAQYTAARDDTEQMLVRIFADKLGRSEQEIGIDDNFFDLGANSLKLLAILDEINRVFNRTLKPLTLFQYTTIHELVQHRFRQAETTVAQATAIQPETSTEVFDFMED